VNSKRGLLVAGLTLAAATTVTAAREDVAVSAGNTATLELETPTGGWKSRNLIDDTDTFRSAYPYNLIDRGRVRGRTPISGRIRRSGSNRTDTIVLNGIAMPLFSGDNGEFERPYAFGSGSNSVGFINGGNGNSHGNSLGRVQFYDATQGRPQAALRIVLSWDDHQAEVDMHVMTPDGGHAYYANPVLGNGAAIDPDGVDGPGPEIFTMAAPPHGAYQVWVNYWGNFGNDGYHFSEETREKPVMTATVTLVTDENTGAEKMESFLVPLRKIGEMTLVKAFTY
jgi:uncharacterized protein YfaP (DUF2135 family)